MGSPRDTKITLPTSRPTHRQLYRTEKQSPAMNYTTSRTEEDLFDILHARFPIPDHDSPTIATGRFALERRLSRTQGPPLNVAGDDVRSYPATHVVSMDVTVPCTVDIAAQGISHPAPSQSPPRKLRRSPPPPPPRVKRTRPASELFLPTPTDPNKRMTFFRLPAVIPEEIAPDKYTADALDDLVSPGHSHLIEEAKIREEEAEEPEEPPMSPISAAIANARFSQLDVHGSVRRVIENLGTLTELPPSLDEISESVSLRIERALTVPPVPQRQLSSATIKTFRSLPGSTRARLDRYRSTSTRSFTNVLGRGESRFPGIDKDSAAAKRTAALVSRQNTEKDQSRMSVNAESSRLPLPKKSTNSIMPWRRKRQGETMSMLIDAGFFPVSEYVYNSNEKRSQKQLSKKGKALRVVIENLPIRPLSIIATPTEFYRPASFGLARGRIRASYYRKTILRRSQDDGLDFLASQETPEMEVDRRPLAVHTPSEVIPTTPSCALRVLSGEHFIHEATSNTTLRALKATDDNASITTSETSALSSDDSTKIENKTDIEKPSVDSAQVSTMWTRNRYIQGPIQLPAPVLAPRKDSIASLAPFQNAVDLIYDGALLFAGHASEERMLNDVLDWYSAWNFGTPEFTSDEFKKHSISSVPEIGIDGDATPIDKEVATQMLNKGRTLSNALTILGFDRSLDDFSHSPTSPVTKAPSDSSIDTSNMASSDRGKITISGYALPALNGSSTLPDAQPSSTIPSSQKHVSRLTPSVAAHGKPTNSSREIKWSDDEDVEGPAGGSSGNGLQSWFTTGNHQNQSRVKEIVGSRTGSLDNIGSSAVGGRAGSVASHRTATKIGEKKKSNETAVRKVRRIVATTHAIV